VGAVIVKVGHVQPVWAGHPWVFAQAVERVEGGVAAGDDVEVLDPRGNSLGRGLYSPGSAIPVRIYTRDRARPIDAALFAERIARAIERRKTCGLPSDATNAFRLVHGEGDDLPGVIVDRFGDTLSVQLGTIGVKRRESALFDALARLNPRAIVDRTPRASKQAAAWSKATAAWLPSSSGSAGSLSASRSSSGRRRDFISTSGRSAPG